MRVTIFKDGNKSNSTKIRRMFEIWRVKCFKNQFNGNGFKRRLNRITEIYSKVSLSLVKEVLI
jgi:hypothetical protein